MYVATPWEFHYTHGKAALLGGKHVGIELPIATELDELWDLVNTSERTRKHLWLMENCNYGRNELAMLKMAHEGVFGDITNGHGGYMHDLRGLLFSADVLHRRLAAEVAHPQHRELLPDARAGADRGLHGHQPRRPVHHASRHRDRAEGAGGLPRANIPRDRPGRGTRPTSTATSITCMIDTAKGRIIRAEHDGQLAAPLQPDQQPGRQPRHRRGLRQRQHRRPGLRRA